MFNDILNLSELFLTKIAGFRSEFDDFHGGNKARNKRYDEEDEYVTRKVKPTSGKRKKKEFDFNFEAFKNIDNIEDALTYARATLPPIAPDLAGAGGFMGSSRMVFNLSNDKVLKVAYNQAGVAQNFFESRLSDQSNYFTKVYDSHPRAWWIVSEKVYPFSSQDDFEAATDLNPELIHFYNEERFRKEDIPELQDYYGMSSSAAQFLYDVINLILRFDLILGDTANPKHWGLNNSGEVKLYDYGLDKYLYDSHLETVNYKAFLEKNGPSPEEEKEMAEYDPANESLNGGAMFI